MLTQVTQNFSLKLVVKNFLHLGELGWLQPPQVGKVTYFLADH